jgi:amino acid transporter
MEAPAEEGGRGLKRNAIGLPGLVAQSLGVTAPEISAVVIAAVVAAEVGGFTPLAFLVAGIGAIGLALIYGRFARFVPSAGGTYSIVRTGLGRDVGFLAGSTVLAVGIVFVPGLLIAGAFLLQNFFALTAPSHPILYSTWYGWAFLLGGLLVLVSYVGIQISARVLLALTAIGVSMLLLLDIVILAEGGAHGWAWSSLSPFSTHGFGFFALGVGIAMTGFSGFETAVFLAEEAHTPKREVPKAVLAAVVLAIGTANFTTRVAFSWGHDGYLPRAFGRTHPRFKSPHVAMLPVYAAVGIAGAVFARFYGQSGIFRWEPYVMLAWIALGILVRLATRARVADSEARSEAAQRELLATLAP